MIQFNMPSEFGFPLRLAYGCRDDVAILNEFDVNGLSILSFKRHACADRVLTLTLVYRKQSMHMQELFQKLPYLLPTHSINITAGNLNYIFFKCHKINL